MTTIDQKILAEIDAADGRDPQRNIKHYRDRLLSEITSRQRFEERQGIVCDKHGRKINLKEAVMTAIDSSYYIGRASDAEEKAHFVSRWKKPTQLERDKISRDVREVIETLIEQNTIFPLDKAAMQKAVGVLSKSLVYSWDEERQEVVFNKLNANGLLGSQTYSFSEILPGELIDQDRTRIERDIKTATYREVAKKLLIQKNPKDIHVNEKIEQLKRRDILEKIPKRTLPQIPKSQIEDEFFRRAAALRNLDPATQGGQAAHVLRTEAKREMAQLDDLTDVQRELDSIKPQPTQAWEGLPNE